MNIVLDIDETLIHAVTRKHKDSKFTIKFVKGEQYYILVRPGLKSFLRYVFKNFKSVNIWTAATKEYAIAILSHILTKTQISKLKFFNTRKQCRPDGSKPLMSIFNTPHAIKSNINKNNTLMVDDKEYVLKHNKGNGIIIPAWLGNPNDDALSRLIVLFDVILSSKLRPAGTELFKLDNLVPKRAE